jgi:hypothetical protein
LRATVVPPAEEPRAVACWRGTIPASMVKFLFTATRVAITNTF